MRPRLVTACSAGTQYEMMYAAGALVALRDLGLLKGTQVFSAANQANVVQLFLWHASRSVLKQLDHIPDEPWSSRRQRAWDLFLGPRDEEKDKSDVFMDSFFLPLLRWCSRNHEWDMMRRRLRPSRVMDWLEPWSCELAQLLPPQVDAFWGTAARPTAAVDEKTGVVDLSQNRPVWLFNASSVDGIRPLCLTNDPRAPRLPELDVEFSAFDAHVSLAHFVAAASCPRALSGPMDILINDRMCAVEMCAQIDPLGLQAVQNYYLKERLGPLPRGTALGDCECKEDDTAEKLVLIDAVTHAPWLASEEGRHVQNQCAQQHTILQGAADTKSERVLAFRKSLCVMHPPRHQGASTLGAVIGHDAIGDIDAMEAAGVGHLGRQALMREVQRHPRSWGFPDGDALRHCANLGYWDASLAFTDPSTVPPRTPLCQSVGDPFGLFDDIFMYRID